MKLILVYFFIVIASLYIVISIIEILDNRKNHVECSDSSITLEKKGLAAAPDSSSYKFSLEEWQIQALQKAKTEGYMGMSITINGDNIWVSFYPSQIYENNAITPNTTLRNTGESCSDIE